MAAMCNLYSITKARDAVRSLFCVSDNRAAAFDPLPSVFPGQGAPVVRRAGDGSLELLPMSWGFVLPQPGKTARRITNARDDKVLDSPFWRGSLDDRRCLVPATSFAEPKGQRPAIWHWFALDHSRPVFAFAGLWRPFRGRLRPDGEFVELDTFAFLTTVPNEIVKPIHPTRMPVMLTTAAEFDLWMSGSTEQAFALARPFPAQAMMIVATGDTADDA